MMESINRFDPAQIVGGQIAPSPIPWQVSVQKSGIHHCGATILDDYTLLSAAHCYDNKNYSVNGLTIRAGTTSKSNGGQVCIYIACQVFPTFVGMLVLSGHFKFLEIEG